MPRSAPLTLSQARRVVALAEVDPRTLSTYLDGSRTPQPRTVAAIDRALRKIKRGDLVRQTQDSAAA
jgi:hypothetical protein